MTRRHEVYIPRVAEIAAIQNSQDLFAAAGVLSVRNAVYVVRKTTEQQEDPTTCSQGRAEQIARALSAYPGQRLWIVGSSTTTELIGARSNLGDKGMHADYRFIPNEGATTDSLDFHFTPFMEDDTQLHAIFANGTLAYWETRNIPAINAHLTQLLTEGKTDTRYVDPESFQETITYGGDGLLFRPNELSGRPFLHSFQTEGPGNRQAEITRINNLDAYPSMMLRPFYSSSVTF